MMKLARLLALPLTLLFALSISGCDSGGGSSPPPTIVISGTVVSAADSLVLVDKAQVTLVNIETQQNEVDPVFTDVNGFYTFTVPPGSYEVRVSAQGYKPSPVDGISGIPVTKTATFDVALETIDPGIYGSLKLHLVGYSKTNGALVILNDPATGDNYTGVTSVTGDLMMYNIPVADYSITIKSLGHETYTSLASVTISDSLETAISDITLTVINGFTVSGTVTFLAVENGEVDVSLTDQETGAVIPGTNVNTVSTNYSINSVAPGSYYIRATFKIDGYVVDPDSIVKHGEPEVNVVAANLRDQNIDVTGAVILNSPIVPADGTPVEINTLTPTLSWAAYPSTLDYVVEVRDVNGDVMWGGFSTDGLFTKLVNPPKATTSIVYSDDGQGLPLENGKIYRWKVYASVKDVDETTGWKLISVSEEAQGVFKVIVP